MLKPNKKRYSFRRCRKGLSLVEIITVLCILSGLLVSAHLILSMGSKFYDLVDARIKLQQELKIVSHLIIDDLRMTGASSILDVPLDGNWHNEITFRVSDGVSNGTVTWGDPPIQYTLDVLNPDKLQRIEGDNKMIIAQNVQLLQFRRKVQSPDRIEVEVQLSEALIGADINEGLSFEIRLRN